MRQTKRLLIASLFALLLLSANGVFFILQTGIGSLNYAPEPFSGESSTEYEAKSLNVSEENPLTRTQAEAKNGMLPVNLMVLGLDNDKTRCDVIMLLNFDPNTSSLNILSIARDTRVRSGRSYRKINSLYSKGGEKLVADEICNITGLPVHYYITADFRGFRKIIDTLDGVEFYVPFRMKYDDPTQNLHIYLKKGLQVLDGKKAEQLVRYRKGNLKGQGYIEGDIGRIKMQQDFIRALIDQKLKAQYISKADDIFAIIRENVKTNIEITDIARYFSSIVRLKSENIKTFVLPGESYLIGDVWWYIHDREQTAAMISENFMLS
jgi:LCP family protein required for cell wall assembly